MLTKEFISKIRSRLAKDLERLDKELKNVAVEDPKKPVHFVATYDETGSDSEDDNSV